MSNIFVTLRMSNMTPLKETNMFFFLFYVFHVYLIINTIYNL